MTYYRTVRRQIPVDSTLDRYRCEKLKSNHRLRNSYPSPCSRGRALGILRGNFISGRSLNSISWKGEMSHAHTEPWIIEWMCRSIWTPGASCVEKQTATFSLCLSTTPWWRIVPPILDLDTTLRLTASSTLRSLYPNAIFSRCLLYRIVLARCGEDKNLLPLATNELCFFGSWVDSALPYRLS